MAHEILTLEAAASEMGLSTTTLKSMAFQGEMPCRMRSGNYVFSQDDVDLWLSKHIVDGDTKHIAKGRPAKSLSELCPRECICCQARQGRPSSTR